jgi:hypothetical protein
VCLKIKSIRIPVRREISIMEIQGFALLKGKNRYSKSLLNIELMNVMGMDFQR